MPHFAGLTDYYIVQDTTPGTGPWSLVSGAIVAWSDATLATWLSSGRANNPAEEATFYQILDCASASGGAATSLHINDTSQFTNGQKWNVSSTGLYDGNQTITVLDGTHVTIPVAFAGTATGFLAGAAVVQTMAQLLSIIDQYNQKQIPPSSLGVTTGVNYQMANTPPAFFSFAPTASNLVVKFPQANLPGSIALGRTCLVLNNTNIPFTIEDFAGGEVTFVPAASLVAITALTNTSQQGSYQKSYWAQANRTTIANADATLVQNATLFSTYVTNQALTAPRTWTLPAANKTIQSSLFLMFDEAGGVTSTNTISVARAGADTINGSASSIVLNRAHDWVLLETDGASQWTIVGGKGALASTDLSDLPIPVASGGSGAATLTGLLVGNGTSPFTAVSRTAAGSWTPSDQSVGGGNTFSGVSVQYDRLDNRVFVSGQLTYPNPVSNGGSTAVIGGLPVAIPNANYVDLSPAPCIVTGVAGLGASLLIKNSSTFEILLATGGIATNTNLQGATLRFGFSYPAS